MKPRVLTGKALPHEPVAVFFGEPTAAVDVERGQEMWTRCGGRGSRVGTTILTTHMCGVFRIRRKLGMLVTGA